MTTRYTIHLIVEVSELNYDVDTAYEWEAVARRVVNRLKNRANRPLDRDGRLKISAVVLDEATELKS